MSGPKSGLYEDFIEREKGLGTLRRDVKGQVLDPSRGRGMTVMQRSRLDASTTHRETFAQLQIASAVLSRSLDLHPPLILREPQHERPRPHRERLCKGLINGGGKDYPALPLGSGSGGGMTRDTHPSPSRHASAYLRFPLRERGGTAWPRSTLRSSRGGLSAWLPPRLSGLSARRILHRRMFHL